MLYVTPSSGSHFRSAIDLTSQTIERRARNFRNLVVTVVLVTAASAGWAVVSWRLAPLAGLFLLFPICGFFFYLDARLLNDWRCRLAAAWESKQIEFWALGKALSMNPALPKDTLQGMLATLPSAADALSEQGLSSSTREAIGAAAMTVHACRSDAMAFRAAGYAIVGGSLIIAVELQVWQWLLGVFAVMALLPLQQGVRLWRLRRSRTRTLAAQRQPDFNEEKYMELAGCLDWEPIKASKKDKFLAKVRLAAQVARGAEHMSS